MFSIFKYIKYILPLVLVASILLGYLKLKSYDPGKTDPSAAITARNVFFIETSHFHSFINILTEDNDIWNDMNSIPGISEADSLIRFFKDLQAREEQIRLLFTGKVILALNKEPDGNFTPVFISRQMIRRQDNILIQALKGMRETETISNRKFEGAGIYEIHLNTDAGIKSFTFAFKKGLFIFGLSPVQIEEALTAIGKTQKPSPVHRYTRIRATVAENISANVFFNFHSLDDLFNAFTSHPVSKTDLFAASGGFDLDIRQSSLSLNGFITVTDSLKAGINIISDQNPAVMILPEFIPASANLFLLVNFTSPLAFFTSQPEYELWKPNLKKLREINAAYSIDLLTYFHNNISGEFGLATLNKGNKFSRFFIAEVHSGSNTENQLKEWAKQWANANRTNASQLHYYRKIDNQSGIDVYRLPLGGIPGMVFGQLFKNVDADYFTVFRNCLIFGNSVEETADYAYQLMLGRNITETEKFKTLQEDLLSRTNFFLYLEPFRSAGALSAEMTEKSFEFYNEHKETLRKFTAFTLQANCSDDLFYTRMFMNFSRDFNEHVNTVWQSKLDTFLNMKPAIVTNHTTGGKEIMVQDAKHQLYLISDAGRILWKIQLEGNILSEIYQIDYYKNRRLQYLFNTRNKIYLIDRNGNFVEKYPHTLRSPASNGLALFDYEGDGNIRICIAGENRQIYLYDKEGRVVPGWNPPPTDHLVTKPVQHFRIGTRDYIVASDIYKTYIYDRRGQIRVNPSRQYPVSQNNLFYADFNRGKEKVRLISTDSTGNILYIYLTGNSTVENRNPAGNNHFFVLSDLNGNGRNEYILADGNGLVVTDEQGKIVFQETFKGNISHKPVIFEFARNDRKIGVVIENEEKIYLFNSNGTLYNGFPLKGSTLFSISSFPDLKGRFNLIVGNKDNFLYNYSVQ